MDGNLSNPLQPNFPNSIKFNSISPITTERERESQNPKPQTQTPNKAKMKASLKLREDQKPLFRAKVPLNILGFPFQSGVAAGDSKELSLNLATFFQSGPSLKLLYRPNDAFNPFSFVVKTGIGSFGSPISSPLAMSAEFNLVGRGNPSFFLQFRPQIGDFSLKKSSSSLSFAPKIVTAAKDHSSDDGKETVLDNGVYHEGPFGNHKSALNGLTVGRNAVSAMDGIVNGVEVSARTVLPIRNRAVLKCRWGLNFPSDDLRNPTAEISFRKIPFLVMSKIAIEHVADEVSKEESAKRDPLGFSGGNADVAEACLAVQRQLEGLKAENALMRRAVQELRSEIGAPGSMNHDGGKYGNGGSSNGRKYGSGKGSSELGEFAGNVLSEEMKKP